MASSLSSEGNPPSSGEFESGPANIALHLLCPSLPPPSRFTLKDLPRSTTVAGLKARVSQSIPSRPSPENQRLIYRGKPIWNPHETLQTILEPSYDSEYTIHLVLPPAPVPSAPADSPVPTPTQEPVGDPIDPGRFAMPNFTSSSVLRDRSSAPSRPESSEVNPDVILRIRAIRRRVEQLAAGTNASQATATTTSSDAFSSHMPSLFQQQTAGQRGSEGFLNPSISATPHHPPSTINSPFQFAMPSNASTARSSMANSELSDFTDNQQLRLQILRHQIALGEDQLSRGIAPPFDHIIGMRSQLFQLLDDQYRNPLARRDGSVESLLTRVFNMYTRADQLRVMQTRSTTNLQSTIASSTANADTSTAPLYLLSSPDGYQGLVTSPAGAGTTQASLAALRATHPPGAAPLHGTGNVPDAHAANLNAALMENVVHRAVINQRLNSNNIQLGLALAIRRMWLFVRLYFFCYMFSDPGTWTRIFFVCLAVIISLLSDTGVPQRLHATFLAPVQRHLEGVIDQHPQPGRRTAAGQAAMDPAAQPTEGRRGLQPTGLWHNIRQAERSLVFFMGSLIPGVGERYVAASNAAEARNTQREREEEEEEENRHQQEEVDGAGDADQHAQDTDNNHAHPTQDTTTANETHTTIPQYEDGERG